MNVEVVDGVRTRSCFMLGGMNVEVVDGVRIRSCFMLGGKDSADCLQIE